MREGLSEQMEALDRRDCLGGNLVACERLEIGADDPEDRTQAIETAAAILLERCEGGSPKSCEEIAREYCEKGTSVCDRTRTEDHFHKKALNLYIRGCRQGDGVAYNCMKVIVYYMDGSATRQQVDDAIKKQREACLAGDPMACNKLGTEHLHGYGAAKDPEAALSWYQKGCELGLLKACSEAACLTVVKDHYKFDRSCLFIDR